MRGAGRVNTKQGWGLFERACRVILNKEGICQKKPGRQSANGEIQKSKQSHSVYSCGLTNTEI